tara:strand:+ start:781 stop:1887 length:1107 start_codon:yes stop_codon:yes gene_type:complete
MDRQIPPRSSDSKDGSLNRVAIIGASGYGGLQSIRLLRDHPFFKVTFLGGDRSAGKRWNELCPFLPLDQEACIEKPEPDQIASSADYALLSLPNGLASQLVPQLLDRNVRVLDLSADYRYRNLDQWKQIYVKESDSINRQDFDLCSEAVYGLSEWNAHKISQARIVSCPGCFPTASLLPLLPFLKQGLIENDGLIIDAKTGTSGGGRTAKEHLLLSEASEAIAPYGVIGHRHTSEIEQHATEVAGRQINVQFTPHLVPMVRGLLATVYGRLRDPGLTAEDCITVLETMYRDQHNIDILKVGTYPSTKWVKYTNKAILTVQVDSRTGRLVLMSAIDNLIKGQAGQAIQNLNLMAGLPQETGLPMNTFYP